jgi:hypothetical protein
MPERLFSEKSAAEAMLPDVQLGHCVRLRISLPFASAGAGHVFSLQKSAI